MFSRSKKKEQSNARVIGAIDKEQHAKTLGVDKEQEPAVFDFLAKALDHPLPEPWQEHADKKGRVFYWNPAFRQSTWQHPLISTHKALVGAHRRITKAQTPEERAELINAEHEAFQRQGEEELSQWRQSTAPDGTAYYYKVGTQLTRWDNPRDHLMSVMELRSKMLAELMDVPFDDAKDGMLALEDGKPESMLGSMQGLAAGQSISPVGARSLALRSKGTDLLSTASSATLGETFRSVTRELSRQESPVHAIKDVAGTDAASRASSPAGRSGTAGGLATAPGLPGDDRATRSGFHATGTFEVPGITDSDTRAIKRHIAEASAAEVAAGRQPLKVIDPVAPDSEVARGGLQPDEFALQIGVNFRVASEKAAFECIRPLILRPLPAPWQVIRLRSGACGFYHPGVRETRTKHPLSVFFAEIFQFLKQHSKTDVPMTEVLSQEIFREASPGEVRRRLGLWQGPLEDTTVFTGRQFARMVQGEDPANVWGDRRPDDPRLEASENLMARLSAWHHLWVGFSPEEPFPFIEHRMQALALNLGEAVVTAPGAQTSDMLDKMLGLPPPKEVAEPTPEPIDVQPPAIDISSEEESEDSDGETERLRLRIQAEKAEAERRRKEEEERLRREEEERRRREEEERLRREEEERLARLAREAAEREARRRAAEELARRRAEQARKFGLKMNLPVLDDDSEKYIKPVMPPLNLKPIGALEDSVAEDWASWNLRPYSPTKIQEYESTRPGLPPKDERPKCKIDEKVWKEGTFVLHAVVKPWVSDLGWFLAKRVGETQFRDIPSPRPMPFDISELQEPLEAIFGALPDTVPEPPFAATLGPQPPAGSAAGRARKAVEANVRRSEAMQSTPSKAGEDAAEAARRAGGLLSDMVWAAAYAAARIAINDVLPIEQVASEAASAARRAGGSVPEAAAAAGNAATMAALNAKMSPPEAGKAAAEAAKAAGGSLQDIAKAAGDAAGKVAMSGGLEEDEVAQMAADAARNAGALKTDVVRVAADAAAGAAITSGKNLEDVEQAAVEAAKASGGTAADIAEAAGTAAGKAAIAEGRTVEEVGKAAAAATQKAGGFKKDGARIAAIAAAYAAITAGLHASEVTEQATKASEEAGGLKRDCAKAAGMAASMAALATGASPAAAGRMTVEAAEAIGCVSKKDISKAAGLAAAKVAGARGRTPDEVGKVAAKATKNSGGSATDSAKVAGQAAAAQAVVRGDSVEAVSQTAARVTKANGGPAAYVRKAAGKGAQEAAVAAGMTPSEAGKAAAQACRESGGSTFEIATAAGAAAAKAARNEGQPVERLVAAVIRVAEEEGVEGDELAAIAAAAAGKSVMAAGRSPLEAGKAAVDAAKSAHGTAKEGIKLAGQQAAKCAIAKGEIPSEVAKRASAAARAVGGSVDDTARAAAFAATEAAIAGGMSSKQAGKLAAELSTAAGANEEEAAGFEGEAMGRVLLDRRAARIAGKAADTEKVVEDIDKMAKRVATLVKKRGGRDEDVQNTAREVAMNAARLAGLSAEEVEQAGARAEAAAEDIAYAPVDPEAETDDEADLTESEDGADSVDELLNTPKALTPKAGTKPRREVDIGDGHVPFLSPTGVRKKQREENEKADEFSGTLGRSNTNFDSTVGLRDFRPVSPGSGQWRKALKKVEVATSLARRLALQKPAATQTKTEQQERDERADCIPVRGAIACPPSPARGPHPVPPHLVDAQEPVQYLGLKRHLTRPLSANAVRGCGDASGQKAEANVVPPEALARPSSADAKLRRSGVRLDADQRRQAEQAALTVKRFLNRLCGTIEVAFAKFEKSMPGMIQRHEWEAGLTKLGFKSNCDVQAIFTALDKRGHNVLTLSDLHDHYNGTVHDGLKAYGMGEVVSEICYDAVDDGLQTVINEVFRELLQEELWHPSGPMGKMPDVKKWIKKREQLEKARRKQRAQELGISEEELSSDTGSGKIKDSNRKTPKGKKGSRSPSGKSGRSRSARSGRSGSATPKGRKGKSGRKKGASGRSLSSSGRSSLGKSGRSGRSTSGRRTGRKGGSDSLGRSGRLGSSGGRHSGKVGSRKGGQRGPDGKLRRRRKRGSGGGDSDSEFGEAGARRKKTGQAQKVRVEVPPHRKYRGFEFADAPMDSSGAREIAAAQRERMLPWVPRPVDEMCRTYQNVYHMLNNPRLRRSAASQDGVKKKPLQLSVAVPAGPAFGGGGCDGDSEGDPMDTGYAEDTDTGRPPGSAMSRGQGGIQKSSSSSSFTRPPGGPPDTGHAENTDTVRPSGFGMQRGQTGASKSASHLTKTPGPTVAGAIRPGSKGLVAKGAGSTSLPTLKPGSAPNSAARRGAVGMQVGAASGIDAESRLRGKTFKGIA